MTLSQFVRNALLMSAIMVADAQAGPISRLYVTDADNNRMDVVQGNAIAFSFNTVFGPGFAINPGPVAVTDTIKTINYNNGGGAEYFLNGTATGTTYATPNAQGVFTNDGTTDNQHIFTVNRDNGDVYQMDMDWSNQQTLFTLQAKVSGITYDTASRSLWLSNTDNGKVLNYSLAGLKLGEFDTGVLGLSAAAFDPADKTLWFSVYDGTGTLKQYSRSGSLLSTVVIPGLSGFNLGMDAQFAILPEPGGWALLPLGLTLLAGFRNRAKLGGR